MQLVSVAVHATSIVQAAAVVLAVVAADGAVGQRGRAASSCTGRRRRMAELPLTVQLVSVVVPEPLYRPPPLKRSCR